jgi:outer membrane receptor protein involved in Fe transport
MMQVSIRRFGRHTLLGSAVVGILAAAAASAQQAPADQAQEATELEEIVVTGSRIMRASALEGTIPVTSVAATELLRQGDINLGDALNDLPALRSTYSQGNSTRFIGTAGLNLLDLRGLGVSRTLVLVNGRRHITASPGEYLVDTNTIPSELIERVDVVTGGNSSIYGSDAVAGVVNFITKRDYEGLELRGQMGTSDRGDRDSEFFSITAGTNFAEDRGNVAVALEYGKQDALYRNERNSLTGAYSGRRQFNVAEPIAGEPAAGDGIPDNRFFDGGIFNGNISDGGWIRDIATATSCATLPEPTRSARCLPNGQPRIFSFDQNGNLVQTIPTTDFRPFGATSVRLADGRAQNIGDLSTLNNTGMLAAGLTRYSANLLAHYDFSDAVRPFLEAKFVRIEATQEGQPYFVQGGLLGTFRCNNPFLSSQALGVLQSLGRCADPATNSFGISRFNVDWGGRGEEHTRDTYRIVLGLDGTFNDDWRYEVAFNYGKFDSHVDGVNQMLLTDIDGNFDGYLLAKDAVRNSAGQIVCAVNADANPANDRPDCVPINMFGSGAVTRAMQRFSEADIYRDEEAEEMVWSAYFSGDTSDWFELPGGAAGFALGAEYRTESAYSAWDPLTAAGATSLNTLPPFDPPDLKVGEVFGEVRLPILSGLPFAHELSAEAAYRYSDYNTDVGAVSAYNVGLIWAPIQDVRLRGNYSTSVRAPTQSDLYSSLSETFSNGTQDPCDFRYINQNPNRPANCAAAGVPVNFDNVPARTSGLAYLQGGNPDLKEEEGTSYTIGTVIMPRALPGFALSVDYWNIEVENLISTLSAQTILNECYNSSTGIDNVYCATIRRNPDGTFNEPFMIASGFNFAKQETSGIDVDASYQYTFDNGHKLAARGILTYLLELNNYLNVAAPNEANRQKSELGDPELSFNVNVNYEVGPLDVSYGYRYIGKQTIATFETQHSFDGRPATNRDAYPRKWYPAFGYHNIRGEFALNDMVSLFAGVDNLTDELPPLGLLGVGSGEMWDAVGRYYYGGFKINW